MKKILSVLLIMVLVLSVVGCSNEPAKNELSETSDEGESEIKIGLSISTLNNPFFVTLKEGAEEAAKEGGAEVIVLDANDNVSKQISDVEDLIQQKVDVIIINPTDSDAVVTAVEAANEANIPVVTIDRSANGGDVTSYIASDNVKGGVMAAEYIVEALGGKGKVVEIQGIPGASPTRDRGNGFHSIVDNEEGIEVVASQPADYDRAKGLETMENILQAHPEIDAVFAHNDEMALGALEAIEASQRSIILVGFDATDDGLKAIEEGRMAATIAEKAGEMGKLGVRTSIKIAKGEKVDAEIPLEVELITKD